MIWTLLKKDLWRKVAQPGGFLLLLVLPLLLALLLGLVFGSGDDKDMSVTVSLLVEDRDDSFGSRLFMGALGQGELASLFDVQTVDSGEGSPMMEQGKASALLIIPTGFGANLLHQRPTTLSLIKNPEQSFLPEIAQETITLLAEAGDRFLHLADRPLTSISDLTQSDAAPSDQRISSMAIQMNHLVQQVQPWLLPPLIELDSQSLEETDRDETPTFLLFAYLLAGISVMTLFFLADALARDFVMEQEKRTLARLISSPVPLWTFILSKLLFITLGTFVAEMLVWAAGFILFGIPLPQILPFLVLTVLIAAALTGTIAVLHALIHSREQVSAIAPAVIIVFSILGGAMVPLHSLPEFIKAISVISPVYWGVDGLLQLLLDQGSWKSVTPHLMVLSGIVIIGHLLSFGLFARKNLL